MAGTIRCLNLVLSDKGNGYKEYKWILVFLKLKGVKGRRKREKGGRVRLSVKRG